MEIYVYLPSKQFVIIGSCLHHLLHLVRFTHCGPVTPHGDSDLSQIGSGNACRHQAITWTNVVWLSVKSNEIHIRAISQELHQPSITTICLKITCLECHWNFPRANELIKICVCIHGYSPRKPFILQMPVWVVYCQGSPTLRESDWTNGCYSQKLPYSTTGPMTGRVDDGN